MSAPPWGFSVVLPASGVVPDASESPRPRQAAARPGRVGVRGDVWPMGPPAPSRRGAPRSRRDPVQRAPSPGRGRSGRGPITPRRTAAGPARPGWTAGVTLADPGVVAVDRGHGGPRDAPAAREGIDGSPTARTSPRTIANAAGWRRSSASSTTPALGRAMPAGWTVAGVLAHLAFWDQRIVVLCELLEARRGGSHGGGGRRRLDQRRREAHSSSRCRRAGPPPSLSRPRAPPTRRWRPFPTTCS